MCFSLCPPQAPSACRQVSAVRADLQLHASGLHAASVLLRDRLRAVRQAGHLPGARRLSSLRGAGPVHAQGVHPTGTLIHCLVVEFAMVLISENSCFVVLFFTFLLL